MSKRMTTIIKAITGIIWTAVFAAGGMVLFMGTGTWAQKLLIDNNVHIISKYTGGVISYEKEGSGCLMVVHEPVRDGIFVKSGKSFTQVDWLAKDSLPGKLGGKIDIDGDGRDDLWVDIDTKNSTATYEAYGSKVEGLAARSSVVDYIFKTGKDGKDSVYYFRNRNYGGIVYEEGISIRIIM
jgi:hypothetical protein